jgi:hypothetical protein
VREGLQGRRWILNWGRGLAAVKISRGPSLGDILSFRLNFEVGALVRDAEFVAEARRQFEQDLKASHALNLDEVLSRGRQSSLL